MGRGAPRRPRHTASLRTTRSSRCGRRGGVLKIAPGLGGGAVLPAGFIGGSLAARLVELGWQVRGLVRNPERAALLEQRGVQPVLGDLDDVGHSRVRALRARRELGWQPRHACVLDWILTAMPVR